MANVCNLLGDLLAKRGNNRCMWGWAKCKAVTVIVYSCENWGRKKKAQEKRDGQFIRTKFLPAGLLNEARVSQDRREKGTHTHLPFSSIPPWCGFRGKKTFSAKCSCHVQGSMSPESDYSLWCSRATAEASSTLECQHHCQHNTALP